MLGLIIFVFIVFNIVRFISWSQEKQKIKLCDGPHKWERYLDITYKCRECGFIAGVEEEENE